MRVGGHADPFFKKRRGRQPASLAGCLHQASLGDEAIVLRMSPDPEPEEPIRRVNRQRAVVRANANRVETLNSLETERGVLRIRLQQRELLVREFTDDCRERVVALPEAR